MYFDNPTQIKFSDQVDENGNKVWTGGIAYQGNIICGCCGGVFTAEDLENPEEDIIPLPWINIEAEIAGS